MVQLVHFFQIGITFFIEYVVNHIEVWLRQWMNRNHPTINIKFFVLQEVVEAECSLDTCTHQLAITSYVKR
ncbi:hypothetical protein D3C78_1855630 [compost metagenome]